MSNTYDRIVIEFQKENESVGSAIMDKKDIDTLVSLHGQTLEEVIGNLTKTLEDAVNKRNK